MESVSSAQRTANGRHIRIPANAADASVAAAADIAAADDAAVAGSPVADRQIPT